MGGHFFRSARRRAVRRGRAGIDLHLEDWTDRRLAVLDAVGSERTAIFSTGPVRRPDRAAARRRPPGADLVAQPVRRDRAVPVGARLPLGGHQRRGGRHRRAGPRRLGNGPVQRPAWTLRRDRGTPPRLRRLGHDGPRGAGPATNASHSLVLRSSDVRAALAAISCPTLIINHVEVDDGRFLAEHIADVRYVELHDHCHLLFSPELDGVMASMSEMFSGSPIEPSRQRVLTTLLFTDIVDSTASVAAVGDRRWGIELDLHDDMIRRHIEHFDGREIKTLGDGFIAVFDGPTRAVQCALAISHEADRRSMTVRAGVHTGEVEMRGRRARAERARRPAAVRARRQRTCPRQPQRGRSRRRIRAALRSPRRPAAQGVPGRWGVYEASNPPQPLRVVSPTTTTLAEPATASSPATWASRRTARTARASRRAWR